MLEIIGWGATFLVGFVLGLLGGGGSILIVPVLVYLFGQSAETSTSLSLLVVGLAAAAGLALTPAKRDVIWRVALIFAIPSGIGAFLARRFFIPFTPNPIFSLSKDTFILLFFAVLMAIVGIRMIKKSPTPDEPSESQIQSPVRAAPAGFLVGTLAGYLGAGGGFLIVPALTQILRISITSAIPTSLAIIAAQSLIGFTGAANQTMDYMFALTLTAVAIAGFIGGNATKSNIDPQKLKPIFGYFVLIIGLAMTLKELVFQN